ncbi:MAG: hypothetical protein KIT16_13440 [Rhodospirillaceae bacterium]|nr:hypothetical protein [Rhodospirillaceae bacterium]
MPRRKNVTGDAGRRTTRRIRAILNRDWDPIGGCPEDEYDTYVHRIVAMLRDGATDDELVAYLEWAEAENMGLGRPFDRVRAVKVIAAIRGLSPSPNST